MNTDILMVEANIQVDRLLSFIRENPTPAIRVAESLAQPLPGRSDQTNLETVCLLAGAALVRLAALEEEK